MVDTIERAALWKRALAVALDLFMVFFVLGWVFGHFTGSTTEEGFHLENGPAVLLFVLIVAYFFVGRRYAGGTLWDHILLSPGRSRNERQCRH